MALIEQENFKKEDIDNFVLVLNKLYPSSICGYGCSTSTSLKFNSATT